MAAYTDLPIDELRAYRPDLAAPTNLDDFWADTLREARTHPLGASFQRIDSGLRSVETFDVRFAGFGGDPIAGWLHLPARADGPLPAIVQYVGYGGGRGLPHETTLWAQAGYAHFVMDTRGQGSEWRVGDTPVPDGSAPAHPGFMTRGVLDPATYYYRRLITDAVRAVEAVREHPAVDADRIGLTGRSQGGGLSIAVAALGTGVAAIAPDVPFLSDFPRAVTIADTAPYSEIAGYLRTHRDHTDRVFGTLAHIDVAILGRRASAPALFAVGLVDDVTPPSTVYAAYNHYGGPKSIVEYPFNGHEGGEAYHDLALMRFFEAHLRG